MLCQLQLKQEESDRRHDETRKMYDDLAQKFSIFQDFVASNVGCAQEEALTYTTVDAAPHPATTTPPLTSPKPETAPFTSVRNGATPTNKSFLPIATYNRFAVLAEEEEEAHETRLIGDSITKKTKHGILQTRRRE
ncbi:hypothetical protein Pcinc_014745 [Petrolisthes cinctipes]|uniref:Uncharacterized protein n=1 Tax=Petrolisthes cinctipes TaxID=88211 RepID=A0AAE1KQE9_PETCI|nr:hypothetical protein Pcinc_014745 [Petrolisthes cinctipes]